MVGDTSFQLTHAPALGHNTSVWDLLAQPVHQALIKFPERLSDVVVQTGSAGELLQTIDQELRDLSLGQADLKGGRFSLSMILAILALCMIVVLVLGLVLYLYLYKRALLFSLVRRVQKLRSAQAEACEQVTYSSPASTA